MPLPNPTFFKSQQGAALIVSLLLLLVMTILAISASQMTRMQERMAANTRDRDLALQSTEAGLRNGERVVDGFTSAPIPCSAAPCTVYELNILSTDLAYRDKPWWDANAWRYATSNNPTTTVAAVGSGIRGNGMAGDDPYFVIEELEEVTDSLTIPPTGPPPSRFYYRITAAGQGGTDSSQVVLQSTFARRY